jgi:predicted TIM-barrel fold metal-dependent hydrolase
MGLAGPGMLSRRDFINGTIGAGVALAAQDARTAEAQMNTRKRTIVDAQVHLWKAESPDWPWVPGRKPQLPEPFTIEKLVPLMDEAGVDRVVVVPPSWPGDRNDYGLEAAQRYPQRFAVMGRIPLEKPESAARLPKWKEQPGMLGIRLTFLGPQAAWLTDGTANWIWPAAEKAGLPIMFLAPGRSAAFAPIAERHPGLIRTCRARCRPRRPCRQSHIRSAMCSPTSSACSRRSAASAAIGAPT